MALDRVVPEQSLRWPDEWPEAVGSLCLVLQCSLPIFIVIRRLHTEKEPKWEIEREPNVTPCRASVQGFQVFTVAILLVNRAEEKPG